MNKQEQLIYLLGYIKASIECICRKTNEEGVDELFNLLADLEANINYEMKRFFLIIAKLGLDLTVERSDFLNNEALAYLLGQKILSPTVYRLVSTN